MITVNSAKPIQVFTAHQIEVIDEILSRQGNHRYIEVLFDLQENYIRTLFKDEDIVDPAARAGEVLYCVQSLLELVCIVSETEDRIREGVRLIKEKKAAGGAHLCL